MSGLLRIMLAIAVMIAAGYGLYYLWAGTLPAHTFKIAASYGILVILVFIVTLITKPAGQDH